MQKLTTLILFLFALVAQAQTPADWKKLTGTLNFYMCNDMGRNGYYDQKPIAELMGRMAEEVDPECVIAAGDVHHFMGWKAPPTPCGKPTTNSFIPTPTSCFPGIPFWAIMNIEATHRPCSTMPKCRDAG